jgi:hypothetical protein
MVTVLLIVLFVPLEHYRPACDAWRETEFEGPMRDVYIDQLTAALTEEAFGHIRIGDEVFVRLVYPFHYFSGLPTWSSLYGFLINKEWGIAANIARGYGPGNSRIEPPPALIELVEKHRTALIRKFPEKDGTGPEYSSDIFSTIARSFVPPRSASRTCGRRICRIFPIDRRTSPPSEDETSDLKANPMIRRIKLLLPVSAALLLVVLLVPIEPYRPACGSRRDIRFDGPMRDFYVDVLSRRLEKAGFAHIRIGDRIFVKAVYPLYLVNFIPRWNLLEEFLVDMEPYIPDLIARGYGADGERREPPQAFVDIVRKHAPSLKDVPVEEWRDVRDFPEIFHGCEIIRAAALRIEDMLPRDLPELPD